jgi:anti-anti-sigma regulatory factor
MSRRSDLRISTIESPGCVTLNVSGTLDSSTYRELRDGVIKAALGEPTAVIVDVSELHVPSESAWSAFTSARWHVSTWPDIPIVLVCSHAAGRAAIERSGAPRYVPVFPDLGAARESVGNLHHHIRRHARADLDIDPRSMRRGRDLVCEWLTAWHRTEMILTASTVATIFIENVLEHTTSAPVLTLEAIDDRVTVAVSDNSPRMAMRHEDYETGAHTVSGLAIAATLSRTWGSIPTAGGKTVWAVLGPENQL